MTTNTTLTTEDEDMGKRKVEAILADLKAIGIKGARDTPKLREAIKLGAVASDVAAAVDASSGAENPFAYGVAVLVNRLKAGPAPGLACWEDAPRSVVEAKALEVGVGPWDELREQFPAYKARVSAALRVHEEHA